MKFEQWAQTHILDVEGKFSDDPNDPGNWTGGEVGKGELRGTKWGISAAAHPDVDLESLTEEGALRIYERAYWSPIVEPWMSYALRHVYFDSAVNHGVGRALSWRDAHGFTDWRDLVIHRDEYYFSLRDWDHFGRAGRRAWRK